MKKIVLPLMALFLFGCSTTVETDAQESAYESKDLTRVEVNSIEIGTDLEVVYDTLGAPLKEWTSEFVYEELENSITTNELVMLLMIANGRDKDDESFDPSKKSIEEAEKAMEIDKLKMLQYQYVFKEGDESEDTALFLDQSENGYCSSYQQARIYG